MRFIWPESEWKPLKRVPPLDIRVLGVDPSLTATGIAVVYGGKIQTTLLSPPKTVKGSARLMWFYHQFSEVLDASQAELVAIEGYAYGANARQHALGELGGTLKLCMRLRRQDFAVVPPTVLKKFATGKGNADKSIVAKELFKKFGIDVDNTDEVDAAGLSLLALAKSDTRFELHSSEKPCLENIAFGEDI